jgi:hypothetical protein
LHVRQASVLERAGSSMSEGPTQSFLFWRNLSLPK